MFAGLWDTIELVTGKPVKFKFLNRMGLKAILVNVDKAQVDGCGGGLVWHAALCSPPALVQKKDSHIIVQYIVKTCDVHLDRCISK